MSYENPSQDERSGQRYRSESTIRYTEQPLHRRSTASSRVNRVNAAGNRHMITRSEQRGTNARSPSDIKIPSWMLASEPEKINLSPLAKQIIIVLTMILGFIYVLSVNERAYYIGFSMITMICVCWFLKLNRLLLQRGLTTLLGIAIVCYSIFATVTITRINNEAKQAEEAAYEQRLQQQEEAKALRALQTPSPDEIAKGGTTHDGVPLKTPLYYQGMTRYHVDPDCSYVNEKYRPLQTFILYEQLTERKYKSMEPCASCRAPARPHTH